MQLQLINHPQHLFLVDVPLDAPPQTATVTTLKVSEFAILFLNLFARRLGRPQATQERFFYALLLMVITSPSIPLSSPSK